MKKMIRFSLFCFLCLFYFSSLAIAASTDATAIPIKGQAFRVTFAVWDSDGDLVTTGTGMDSEISKDGGTAADCTNEATEIATTWGLYYLDLTATEMTADTVALKITLTNSDSKPTPLVLYPAEDTDIPTNLKALDGSTTSLDDLKDFADAGYNPSTNKVEGVVLADATGTVNGLAANVITPSSIQADAITAAKVAPDVHAESADATWEETLASHTTDGTFGGDFVDADSLATSEEIVDDFWDENIVAAHNTADTAGALLDSPGDWLTASGFAPASEYDTEMARITANVATEAKQDIIDTNVDDIETDTGTTIPATITTAQNDLNIITGTSGVLLEDASITAAKIDADAIDLIYDEVLTGVTHNVTNSAGQRIRLIHEGGGYDDGRIWFCDLHGAAGTDIYENGTVGNPSDSWADVITINSTLGFNRFHAAVGSTITLAASAQYYEIIGWGYTLALGGQSIANTFFRGANVSGVGTGNAARFLNCQIGTVTLANFQTRESALSGTITLSTTGTHVINDCVSKGSPSVDFGSLGDQTLHMQQYNGEIEIVNLGNTGADVLNLSGRGELVLAASCVGGLVNIQGNFIITNNGTGMTINDAARFDVSQNIGIDFDDIEGTLGASEIDDNAFGIEHYQDDIFGFNPWEILGIVGAKAAGPRRFTLDGADWDMRFYALDDLTAAGTPVLDYQDTDSNGQTLGTITITAPF